MQRVITLKEFYKSLESKLKQHGSSQVECIYTTTGETGAVYYSFDLIDKNGKTKKINIKAVRG